MRSNESESVILICYYFPPMGMGGTQRATKFAKYLPQFGWKPIVITVKNIHYYAYDNSLLAELKHIPIHRTESLDPLRLLARFRSTQNKAISKNSSSKRILNLINERIVSFLFIPDSKILWLPFAIAKAIRLIQKNKAKMIWTTSPPQSAHLAGVILKAVTSIKWVADFRDDWTGGESQPCPTVIHSIINRLLEKVVLKQADFVIGMCDHLTTVLQRKSGSTHAKFKTIMNGYDPEDFYPVLKTPLNEKFTIAHCGSISRVSYPETFLAGVKLLLKEHPELKQRLLIQFIGTDIFGQLNYLLDKYQLSDIVSPIQYVPHESALKKIMASHLLLLTILKRTNEEIISGKIFEYLGSGKPILLVSDGGYVANLIQKLGRGTVVKNYDIEGIKKVILDDYNLFQSGKLNFNEPLTVPQFDRKKLTRELAEILKTL